MPRTRSVTSDDREIGARIRSIRAASGITQRYLALAIGVSVQQMAKYEQAYNRLSGGQLAAIARALKVPVGQLFGEDDVTARVPRVRATTNLVRDFCVLDADLQDMVIKIARTLASRAARRSKGAPSARPIKT